MFVPFQNLPAEARLWLYWIPRPLTPTEKQTIEQKLTAFCEQWEAHKTPLQTSFQLLHNQFIALAVDENVHGASGCSIDGSVRVIREIGEFLQADLFQRQYAAYWQDDEVKVVSLPAFKQATLPTEVHVFDQTANTVGELQKRQRINITETWLKTKRA